LWEKYCDFLGDQYGYPYGQILETTQTESGSFQLLIPTAMIPLWVNKRPIQEIIQYNFYSWNHRRILPTEIQQQNRLNQAAQIFIHNDEKEFMSQVSERTVL
jgi:hypothetical protein